MTRWRRLERGAACLVGLLAAVVSPAAAQTSWFAQAVPLATHASPAVYGESRTEAYLTQPMLGGGAVLGDGLLEVSGILNLEGWTLRRGELNAGIWGEGYVDRRHPHTFLHELVATATVGPLSLTAGKGFVPFGTDDPMVRPLVKYPANHHFAQVLERLIAIAAVRAGPAVRLEAALFNGDEPVDPAAWPQFDRFGDSWAVRATLLPARGWELQGSHAWIRSPELPTGGGLDQRKWSVSARHGLTAGQDGGAPYLLVELARTTDVDDGREGDSYRSVLAEGSFERAGTTYALRLEETERPEEERTLDPFRTQRPHPGVRVLGITRWRIATASVSRAVEVGRRVRAVPLLEAAYMGATEAVRPSFFVPEEFYGSGTMWSLSVGVRLEAGRAHARMGRYGVAGPDHAGTHH